MKLESKKRREHGVFRVQLSGGTCIFVLYRRSRWAILPSAVYSSILEEVYVACMIRVFDQAFDVSTLTFS